MEFAPFSREIFDVTANKKLEPEASAPSDHDHDHVINLLMRGRRFVDRNDAAPDELAGEEKVVLFLGAATVADVEHWLNEFEWSEVPEHRSESEMKLCAMFGWLEFGGGVGQFTDHQVEAFTSRFARIVARRRIGHSDEQDFIAWPDWQSPQFALGLKNERRRPREDLMLRNLAIFAAAEKLRRLGVRKSRIPAALAGPFSRKGYRTSNSGATGESTVRKALADKSFEGNYHEVAKQASDKDLDDMIAGWIGDASLIKPPRTPGN